MVANIIVASMLLSTMNYFHFFERTQFAVTGDLSGGSRIKWKSLLEFQDFEKLSIHVLVKFIISPYMLEVS